MLVRIAFEGSHPVRPEGVDPLPYRSHYFLGNDPAGWRTDVPHYAQVVYRYLYDGVDVAYRVGAEGLKYDITVRAGADPGKIAMAYEGVEGLEADGVGLAVHTALGDLFDSIPRSYQGGEEVACRFFLRTTLSYGFDCAGWDASLPLVIDPLLYSTFLGGGESDGWSSVAVDASGSVYGTGTTYSTGFPTTPGAFDSTYNGGFTDAFVTKLNPTGSGLLYSAFLGGIDWDNGVSIAVDASGSAYVIGYTVSTDFPTTPVAFDTSHNGGWNDAFVTKLNPTGSGLLYSTFLGGGDIDEGFSVGVDASGSAYVTGRTWSTDFPTTPGAFDTSHNSGVDAFVTKLNPTGSGLLYSTYLGGGDSDWGFSVAVDSLGSAYLNGVTLSTDFPTTPGAFDTSYNGGGMFGYDVFVTKLNPTGSGLPYSTFLGGGDEEWGYSLAVDASGSAYVTGLTRSTDFPTTPGAFDTSYNGGYQYDAFVAKLDPTGNGLLYSTFLGGGDSDGGSSIAVDASGSAYVTGGTTSTDFPTTPGAFDNTCGTDGNCNFDGFYYGDAFVTKLNPTGSGLLYSTFLGGGDSDGGSSIAVDASGSAYVTGGTTSTDFPTTSGAFDTTHNGEDDAFVANLDLPAEPNAPPLLILTAPLGGEVWDQGSSHAVTWTASDNQDPSTSLVVFINYTSSGGSGTICGPVPGFPGSCDWIAPNIIATDVVVNGTVIDTGGLNGWDESGPFTIQVPPPSTPPTADAGPDQSAFKNDPMVLDGSASSDPDMDPLAYDWVQSSGPQSVTLVPVNASAVTFTAPTGTGAAGVYMFDLTVSDPSGANDTDTANVTVVNRIPVADAGADQVIAGPGSPVLLNGTGSYDPDAEPLSYFWWQIAGPIALFINNATSAVADFIAPLLGVYCFELVVTDPDGANASDGVCVTVQDNPPTALAVATPMIGFIGTPFLFDATGSTDDVGVTAYLWDFGDTATGTNPLSTHAYTARGTFTVSLTVSDTAGQNDTDTLTIQIENRAPTASAIATTPPIYRGQIVVLDGTGSSDPDGDSLTFSWRQVSGPEVSLTGANTATASFVPTELGSYGFNLTVDDGFGGSDEASVMVTVLNRNPVADAGPDQPAAAKNIVLTLDASASSDPDGDALTYAWTAPLGITLSDANSPTPTFTATRSDTYTFLLQVDDGLGGVATDTVVVTVLNTPPVAVANAPATAAKYAPVSLDGTASSDPDGDALTYVWTRVSGPFVTINGQDGALAAFTPAVSGTYGFRLTVDDGDVGGTATDDVVVTATNAAPIAAAGPDQVGVFRGATVTLDGTGSSDPDGDPLTYSWTQTSGPAVALAGANTVTPSFTPAAAGTHVFALTVDDG
ncbi:MAG TPA: PKD domain-containing protein, partial [Thermoplasmata archaeon]|nr:PKD domain-containing protein [Thermoplasmata archaeon]